MIDAFTTIIGAAIVAVFIGNTLALTVTHWPISPPAFSSPVPSISSSRGAGE